MSALTDSIDAEVAALLPEVQSKQTAFASSHAGKFFQGIRTPNPIPEDGLLGTIDKTLHPSDQPEDWTNFGLTLPLKQKWAIEIYFYKGPQGAGYVLGAWVVEATEIKLRRWNFGPETQREVGWTVITPPGP